MDKFVIRTKRVRADGIDTEPNPTATKEIKMDQAFEWKETESLIYLIPQEDRHSDKVASFDLDSTLISTKSGRKFAVDRFDWKFFSGNVPSKLRELHDGGYKVCIFTNQGGIKSGKMTIQEFKLKMNEIISNLSFIPYVFVSIADDEFRKPSSGMWRFMAKKFNSNIKIDLASSFYVGDFAGRIKEGKLKKDPGCSDRKFAANASIGFHTPEGFFLGEKERKFEWDSIDPAALPKKLKAHTVQYTSTTQEVVLLCGSPASGKTTFYQKHFEPGGYVHVNQDTLKTKEKCFAKATQSLKMGKSIVIDNTNKDVITRSAYIEIARKHNIPIRCFWLTTDRATSSHLNRVREKLRIKDHVPDIAFATFHKNFVAPDTSEGFVSVEKIEFEVECPSPAFEKMFMERT